VERGVPPGSFTFGRLIGSHSGGHVVARDLNVWSERGTTQRSWVRPPRHRSTDCLATRAAHHSTSLTTPVVDSLASCAPPILTADQPWRLLLCESVTFMVGKLTLTGQTADLMLGGWRCWVKLKSDLAGWRPARSILQQGRPGMADPLHTCPRCAGTDRQTILHCQRPIESGRSNKRSYSRRPTSLRTLFLDQLLRVVEKLLLAVLVQKVAGGLSI